MIYADQFLYVYAVLQLPNNCTASKLNVENLQHTRRNTKRWSSCFKACQVAALNKGGLTVLFPTLPKYKQKPKGTLSGGHIDMQKATSDSDANIRT